MNNTNPIYLMSEGKVLRDVFKRGLKDLDSVNPDLFKRGSKYRKQVADKARGLMKHGYYGGEQRKTIEMATKSGLKARTTPYKKLTKDATKFLKSKSGGDQAHILAASM